MEPLEHHADPLALPPDVPGAPLAQHPAGRAVLFVADQFAVHPHPPRVDPLKVVEAAQQCGLPGSGGADDTEHFTAADVEVDAFQHLGVTEPLADSAGPEDHVVHAAAPFLVRPGRRLARILLRSTGAAPGL